MTNPIATLPPKARAWGRTIAILGGSLAAYVAVALLVTMLTGDAIAGAAASNLLVAVLAMVYRWRSTGTPLASASAPRLQTIDASFWLTVFAALVLCWLAGQTAAAWVYENWGSQAYDTVASTKTESPVWLLVLTALILAPVGEEALMRGIAYPALRKHWPPVAAAFVIAMVFALLHGNLVQIVLTVPLGILLAFVYEVSQRLWPVILMHVLFNMASSFTPKAFIEDLAQPLNILVLTTAIALLLYALTPGRYAVFMKNEPATAGGHQDS